MINIDKNKNKKEGLKLRGISKARNLNSKTT
jgi:hypothetical protein